MKVSGAPEAFEPDFNAQRVEDLQQTSAHGRGLGCECLLGFAAIENAALHQSAVQNDLPHELQVVEEDLLDVRIAASLAVAVGSLGRNILCKGAPSDGAILAIEVEDVRRDPQTRLNDEL